MKKEFLSNLASIISVVSMLLVILELFGMIEINIMLINLLFITLLSTMTWINYNNNKKVQTLIGILILIIFIYLMV